MELAKAYNPQEAQEKWLKFWNERGYFHSAPDARKPFTIVIPPPNVTGALHMGHALNNTLQDVLIRWRRMQGFNALWMPGTDHAGIATQAVVERLIFAQEKKTRHEIGREELVKRIWQWKDKYEARILGQLRQLGASCDWERTRFTLDPICVRAVRQTFFNLFKDGLIFRAQRLVNWDAFLQTSVANDELENVEQTADFFYFKYPFADGKSHDGLDHVLIATTRPETMLGDTCVAIHPNPRGELEKRERKLRAELEKVGEKERKEIEFRLESIARRKEGMLPQLEKLAALAIRQETLELPLIGRKIPLIPDNYADPEKGTGAVKITPAHDFNDYEVGQRHPDTGLPINILMPDGKINDAGRGKFRDEDFSYVGIDRFDARKRIVADLERLGLVEKIEQIKNSIPLSDRSKTPIEPYLSDQWFVAMGQGADGNAGLAQMAMDAVTSGRVRFFPERYARSYLDWLGEKRDWCISRQLWWGHRIPIWYARCPEAVLKEKFAGRSDVAWRLDDDGEYWLLSALEDLPADVLGDKYPLEQDPDVLDTWFSSMLWPHSTLGWPEKTPELAYYYPTSVLVTSRDIITLWVARMVIAGLYNLGQVPFHHVYITVKLLDGFGETMSKSKGNGVDPLDIIERYGADALRFLVMQISTETQDARLPVANVCPHCDTLVPVKQEHMYMRTKKLACPNCKQPFRPGGPWPSDDPELKTAKQASERFEIGRNFANKIWNAARFILMNLDGYTPHAVRREELPLEDRWILSRLAWATQSVTEQLEGFHFSEVARTLYDFVWSEFCDWYLEMSKGRLKGEPAPDRSPHAPREEPVTRSVTSTVSRATVQRVLIGVLDAIVRLVHPVMPFVAESIWHALNEAAGERGLPNPEAASEGVMIAPWPEFPADWRDAAMETSMARMQELVRSVREVRNRYNIEPKTPLDAFVRCDDAVAGDFRTLAPFIVQLAGIGKLESGPDVAKPPQAASHVTPEFEVYVSLKGLIDPAAEVKRLDKQLADKRKQLAAAEAKLKNENFVKNAPLEVVEQQRGSVADLQKQIDAIAGNMRDLQQ